MRSLLVVAAAVSLAAGCNASPQPELPAAHADAAPVAPPTTLAAPSSEVVSAAVAGAHHAGAPAAVDVKVVAVERAPGADGRTVAEVYAQRKQLGDKTVAVRGTVVKFLPGIMGRNWLHLRDGSGSADAGDNDLTFTTAENAEVGAVVVARGLVRADKDFGSGYAYRAIVEETRLTAERH
jgi:hypothetical protein